MLLLNCCKNKQERIMSRSILKRLKEYGDETILIPAISPVQNSFAQDMDINISMLRLDKIHKNISGNKLFKLQFFLEEALQSRHKTIITFGGAYSNHLAATAYACRVLGIHAVGIVRGEKPPVLSDTLEFCLKNKMVLDFIPRTEYAQVAPMQSNPFLKEKYGEHILIPEGGFSVKGMQGACFISNYYTGSNYSHICVAIGTATTFAGILKNAIKETKIMGFPALKGLTDIYERLSTLGISDTNNLEIIDAYHFGGFGKNTPELIAFMNRFYEVNNIPLDFLYTGKMMFGIRDLLEKKYFPAGSDILCIHTGGLQGNNSIKGSLIY